MAYTPRDVIVYLTDFPYKFLVQNHNGVIARTPITDYTKATNYRNLASGGLVNGASTFAVGDTLAGTLTFVPKATMPSTQDLTTTPVTILDDPTSESAGLAGHGPRVETFTRVQMIFEVADDAATTSPYRCWEDEFRALGDIDPNNELDE